MQQQKTEVC